MGQIWGFHAFWSCSVDFPHYGDTLAEIGHIWGFWALSGERVGVNDEGGGGWRRHISDALRRVLSSSQCSCHLIILKLSGVITNEKSDVHAKGQGQRSKVKVTEVKMQLSRFWSVTPV